MGTATACVQLAAASATIAVSVVLPAAAGVLAIAAEQNTRTAAVGAAIMQQQQSLQSVQQQSNSCAESFAQQDTLRYVSNSSSTEVQISPYSAATPDATATGPEAAQVV